MCVFTHIVNTRMQIPVCVFEVPVYMYTSQGNVERWQWTWKSVLERDQRQHVRGSGGRNVGGGGSGGLDYGMKIDQNVSVDTREQKSDEQH